jgi:hypothetical protein
VQHGPGASRPGDDQLKGRTDQPLLDPRPEDVVALGLGEQGQIVRPMLLVRHIL